eukprot:gene3292-4143_t
MPRGVLSLVFSVAMFCFSGTMFIGTGLHAKYPTPLVAALALILAGSGLIVTGSIGTFPALVVGFGGMFGTAVGLGYGIAVGTANLTKVRKGLVTGICVAAFAIIPVFLAPILKSYVASSGVFATIRSLGTFFAAMSLPVYACLSGGGVQIPIPTPTVSNETANSGGEFGLLLKLWVAFGTGTLAGLIAITHATGITQTFGGSVAQMALTVQSLALGNWAGRLAAGYFADNVGPKNVLLAAALSTAAALGGLCAFGEGNAIAATAVLTLVGAGFGAALTSYAALTSKLFGPTTFGRVYGKVFTGYGFAGIVAPYLAGALYVKFESYFLTLLIAAGISLFSAVLVYTLPTPAAPALDEKSS